VLQCDADICQAAGRGVERERVMEVEERETKRQREAEPPSATHWNVQQNNAAHCTTLQSYATLQRVCMWKRESTKAERGRDCVMRCTTGLDVYVAVCCSEFLIQMLALCAHMQCYICMCVCVCVCVRVCACVCACV